MKVYRSGSQRSSGTTTLVDERPEVSFRPLQATFCLRVAKVEDVYNKNIHYDYSVDLDIKEVAALVRLLSERVLMESAALVHAEFSDKVLAIQKLLLLATGYLASDVTALEQAKVAVPKRGHSAP